MVGKEKNEKIYLMCVAFQIYKMKISVDYYRENILNTNKMYIIVKMITFMWFSTTVNKKKSLLNKSDFQAGKVLCLDLGASDPSVFT